MKNPLLPKKFFSPTRKKYFPNLEKKTVKTNEKKGEYNKKRGKEFLYNKSLQYLCFTNP